MSELNLFSKTYARLSIALVLTTALVAFESLSVVAALAQIGAEFESLAGLPWVVTSFLLASGLAVATTGRLVDELGSRTMFRWASGLFVVSSGFCGMSQSLPLLVLSRALQGAAAGSFLAVSGAAVGVGYPARLRSRVYAMNATVWGVLAFGGPALGGVLLATLGWRSIFLVNVPLAAMGAWLGWSSFPPVPRDQSGEEGLEAEGTVASVAAFSLAPADRSRFDWQGFFYLALAFCAAVVGLSSRRPLFAVPLFSLSLAAALAYVRYARRQPGAVMPWRFFGEVPYRHLAVAAGGAMASGVAVENFLPLYLETARGVRVEWAAWSVLFLTLGWTTAANVVSRLYDRLSERAVILAGAVSMPPLLVASFFCVRGSAPLPLLFLFFYGLGLGIGSVTNASLTLVQFAAQARVVGSATSAHQFVRNVSVTLGTAAGGAALVAYGGQVAVEFPQHGATVEAPPALGGTSVANSIAEGFAAAHGAALLFAVLGAWAAWRLWRGPPVAEAKL